MLVVYNIAVITSLTTVSLQVKNCKKQLNILAVRVHTGLVELFDAFCYIKLQYT